MGNHSWRWMSLKLPNSMKMWKGNGNTITLLFSLNGPRNDGSSWSKIFQSWAVDSRVYLFSFLQIFWYFESWFIDIERMQCTCKSLAKMQTSKNSHLLKRSKTFFPFFLDANYFPFTLTGHYNFLGLETMGAGGSCEISLKYCDSWIIGKNTKQRQIISDNRVTHAFTDIRRFRVFLKQMTLFFTLWITCLIYILL